MLISSISVQLAISCCHRCAKIIGSPRTLWSLCSLAVHDMVLMCMRGGAQVAIKQVDLEGSSGDTMVRPITSSTGLHPNYQCRAGPELLWEH